VERGGAGARAHHGYPGLEPPGHAARTSRVTLPAVAPLVREPALLLRRPRAARTGRAVRARASPSAPSPRATTAGHLPPRATPS
jgi:hypothetical protein